MGMATGAATQIQNIPGSTQPVIRDAPDHGASGFIILIRIKRIIDGCIRWSEFRVHAEVQTQADRKGIKILPFPQCPYRGPA